MSGVRMLASTASIGTVGFIFTHGSAFAASSDSKNAESASRNDNPRTTAAGFDPEALERGAKALREIHASPYAKKVFELMRKQEETRQEEEKARRSEFQAIQAQHETERQRVVHEEQRKTLQQQAQTKAQLARYEDELARKRMQAEHEAQRVRNAELVQLQEESTAKQEQLRRATEEQIQLARRRTEEELAEIERTTLRARAFAEAEARAHEARLSEETNRRLLLERANAEKDKWLAAINSTFTHLGNGLHALLTDRDKLVVLVAGTTALAAGVYTTREGSRVVWGQIEKYLGQPSLVRESSLGGPFPWSGLMQRLRGRGRGGPGGGLEEKLREGEVVLAPSLQSRVSLLASATANTRRHGAPFRNMLFYGPPGTGKTMAAKELARSSGLDYAMMTGGDVAPLGAQAVTKIHSLFDWAQRSRRGLLLFIDEADAFLAQRNSVSMSEAQRSALNALLFRTGDQSPHLVLVLATNRPGDLDSAIADRMDELLEFPLPQEEERFRLLSLYLSKYISHPAQEPTRQGLLPWLSALLLRPRRSPISIQGVTEDVLREASRKLEGFSGREIAKLMAAVQGAVYGSRESVLTRELFERVVDFKLLEHQHRQMLMASPHRPNSH